MTLIRRNGRVGQLPTLWEDFLNRDVFNWGSEQTTPGSSIPAVNIKENENGFEVEMAAPGLKKEDFKIELDGHTLTISAEVQHKNETNENGNYSRREFSYQTFTRTFHLPKDVVNSEKIEAKYENGLLQLSIPKREEAKVKPARMIRVA